MAVSSTGNGYVFASDSALAEDLSSTQNSPAISENNAVWQGTFKLGSSTQHRIFYEDLNSHDHIGKMPVQSNAFQDKPDISGNLVVWLEGSTTKIIRYAYVDNSCAQTSSCAAFTLPLFSGARPEDLAVSGRKIIWQHWRDGATNPDIYLYDLDSPGNQPIAIETGKQIRPDISGDWATWVDQRTTPEQIYAKNLSTGEVRHTEGHSPSVSQDLLVYNDNGIWAWDLSDPGSQPERISPDGTTAAVFKDTGYPAKVVYKATRDGMSQIWMYDFETREEQRVSSSTSL